MLYYFTFTFSSMTHLELIFVSKVKLRPSLLYDIPINPEPFIEKSIFSALYFRTLREKVRFQYRDRSISWFTHPLFYPCANTAAAAAKSLQSCPTLCDPIDGSPPGSPVPGILQAKTLEWVAMSFSTAWKWKAKVKSFSHVQLLATPWTAAYQAPLSMGFPRQEYWSGVPLPSLQTEYAICM